MNKKPQIIAHRGFWKSNSEVPQNSLAALENAQSLNVYGSELDVVMTKDGVLIVNHDHYYFDKEISKTTYAELSQLKLSNDEILPTLESYLIQGAKCPSVKLTIELKPGSSETEEEEIVNKTIGLIQKLKFENQCELISFSLHICKLLKKLAPNLVVFYLKGDLNPTQIKHENIDGIDYHYSIYRENPTWLPEALTLGLLTNAWTANDVEVFNILTNQGIDFITTDIPDVFINLKSNRIG